MIAWFRFCYFVFLEVRMARIFWLPVFLFFSLSVARAGEGTGVGVIVGSPNGVTARHWFDEGHSVDAGAGWSLSDSRFQVHSDYLWTQPDLIQLGDESFDTFFGLGLSLRSKSGRQNGEVVFGPRVPVGISYEFTDPDVEVFTQVALNVGVIPSSDVYVDANIGVRFYF
jgi:hypothetical protein